MNKQLLEKLAKTLPDEQFARIVNAMQEEMEKNAELEKLAEVKAAYDLGQFTAEAFTAELTKIAQLEQADEAEKIAAVYEDYGRQMAREYVGNLIKQSEESKEEEKKEEAKEEKKEESKPEEKKEEKKEEKGEEKSARCTTTKVASAKAKLVSALRQLKK